MKGEKIGSKDLFRKTKTKRDFQYTLVSNSANQFKAGPARAAVFQVMGALDSKA